MAQGDVTQIVPIPVPDNPTTKIPARAPFNAPRSPSLELGSVLSLLTPCAAMWGGRGAVMRPRGVRWRSAAAGVEKYTPEYTETRILEDPF